MLRPCPLLARTAKFTRSSSQPSYRIRPTSISSSPSSSSSFSPSTLSPSSPLSLPVPRTLLPHRHYTPDVRPPIGVEGKDAESWRAKMERNDAARKAKAAQERLNLHDELKSISGANHKELYNTSGKPYNTPLDLCHPANGLVVPKSAAFNGVTFDEESFAVPEIFSQHRATLVVVSFNQQAFDYGTLWMEEFMKKYPQKQPDGQDEARCIHLSVLSNSLIGTLFGSSMLRKLKATVPLERHSSVALIKSNIFDTKRAPSTYRPVAKLSAEEERAQEKLEAAHAAAIRMAEADPSLPLPPPLPEKPRRTTMLAEPGWSIQNTLLCHVFLVDSERRIRWRAVGPPIGEDQHILQRVTQKLLNE